MLQKFVPSSKKDYVVEVDDDDDDENNGDVVTDDDNEDDNDDTDEDSTTINGDRRQSISNRLNTIISMFKKFLQQKGGVAVNTDSIRKPYGYMEEDDLNEGAGLNDNTDNQQIDLDEGFISANRRRLGNKLFLDSLREKQLTNNYYLGDANGNLYETTEDDSLPMRLVNTKLLSVSPLQEVSEFGGNINGDNKKQMYVLNKDIQQESFQTDTGNFQQGVF